MMKGKAGSLPSMPTQYRLLIGLGLVIIVLAVIQYRVDRSVFQRFLGNLNPVIAVFLIVSLGGVLISLFVSRGWFAIYSAPSLSALILPFGLAILLAVVMAIMDTRIVFPEDMNVAFPQSLLFYPVIGYVAEIVFHLLPVAILLLSLTTVFRGFDFSNAVWLIFVLVALIEAVYQASGVSSDKPLWAVVYVGVHLFVFNMLQLSVFKHHGFIPMYAVRLAYYVIWHLLWGHFRLDILF